jgi:GT2 family glycosyltransferase
MLALIQTQRVVGGGTVLRYDRAPFLWKGLLGLSNRLVIPWLKWTPGCFIFCRAAAFRETGGYDERYFAGEDVEFGKALRRWGKKHGLKLSFIRKHPPVTSIRKLDLYGGRAVFNLMVRWVLFPHRTGKKKEGLEMFYDGRR